jgi:predicted nucleic acid-binding protein
VRGGQSDCSFSCLPIPCSSEFNREYFFETPISAISSEVTNVLAMAERRGRITPAQSDGFISDLGKLAFERDEEAPGRAFTHLLPLCRTHRLTSYDAAYVDLAIRRRLPLATLDDDLRKTARKLGIGLLG